MRRRWIPSLLAACLALACEKRFAAVLQVQVETDLADATWLELRTRSQDGARVADYGQRMWPAGTLPTFNLVPLNDDLAANPDAVFEVVAASCGPEGHAVPARCVLVTRRMRVRYREGEVRRIRVALEAACRGVVCGAGTTCAGGSCVDERWDATAAVDGGAGDGGAVDAQTAEVSAADVVRDAQVPRDVPLEDRVTAGDVVDAPAPDTGVCPMGQIRCGASCVDPRVDTAHCGRCDHPCAEGVACGAGSCVAAREVAVLDGDACALLTDDTVRCWGAPFGGVFGVASSTGHHLRPIPVAGVVGRSGLNVATSGYHCVIASPTEVTCWGTGGATTRALTVPAYPIAQLQCGWASCCARLGSGTVGCWGANNQGQLGDGTLTGRADARPVLGVTTATDLACGVAQCCAALADGTVRCWGNNYEGQFGNGTLRDVQATPVVMRGASGVAKVGTGETVSCVLTQAGAVRCVGGDWLGQLGDGPGGVRLLEATPVPSLTSGVTDLRVGQWNACARKTDGSLWCWGSNFDYQSGGATRSAIEVPRRVAFPSGLTVTGFDLGYFTSCAVLSDGSVRCWGKNVNGQVGNGRRDAIVAPTQVNLRATRLGSNGFHNCALYAAGVACWGNNEVGQLGTGTPQERGVPTSIVTGAFTRLAVGNHNTCFAEATGAWSCAGSTGSGQLGLDPSRNPLTRPSAAFPSAPTIAEVSLGEVHTCGHSLGQVACWGANNEGQLGVGTTDGDAHATHAVIAGFSNVTRVAAGYAFTCMLRTGGEVLCWGDNFYGQLGDGSMMNRSRPIGVTLPAAAVGLYAGQDHACALLADGSAQCWGPNRDGSLGDGTFTARARPVALQMPSGVRIRSMTLGQSHACAVTDTSELYCWGSNFRGELGIDREALYSSNTPQRVAGITDVAEAALGWTHTCARRNDGTVWCWGANDLGQLGNGLPEHPAGGFAVRF